MNKFSLILLILLSFYGCKEKEQPKEVVTSQKSNLSIAKKHQGYTNLNNDALIAVNGWKEYQKISMFIKRFKNSSANQAVSNAKEFNDLVKQLKDSIRVKTLKNSAFKARLNVLENEALRLQDMSLIPAITATEVHNQVNKIFLVFSSINENINTFYQQRNFEDEIDVDDISMQLDSTKIDSVSRKTIKDQIKELEEETKKVKRLSIQQK